MSVVHGYFQDERTARFQARQDCCSVAPPLPPPGDQFPGNWHSTRLVATQPPDKALRLTVLARWSLCSCEGVQASPWLALLNTGAGGGPGLQQKPSPPGAWTAQAVLVGPTHTAVVGSGAGVGRRPLPHHLSSDYAPLAATPTPPPAHAGTPLPGHVCSPSGCGPPCSSGVCGPGPAPCYRRARYTGLRCQLHPTPCRRPDLVLERGLRHRL